MERSLATISSRGYSPRPKEVAMPLRVLLGGLLGGIVMFVWGFLFWAASPLPKMSLLELPHEAAVMRALDEAIPASGTYMFPSMTEANHDTVKARYAAGPVGMILIRKGGVDMEDPMTFVKGLLHFMACATIAGGILSTVVGSLRSYGSRALFVFRLGLFAGVAIEFAKAIWFYAPTDFIFLNCAYHFTGWGLAGLAIAAVVKPPAQAADRPSSA
jgi:hypothetical protein